MPVPCWNALLNSFIYCTVDLFWFEHCGYIYTSANSLMCLWTVLNYKAKKRCYKQYHQTGVHAHTQSFYKLIWSNTLCYFYFYSFIHSGYLYSAPSRNLLRGALSPATAKEKCLEKLAERRHIVPGQEVQCKRASSPSSVLWTGRFSLFSSLWQDLPSSLGITILSGPLLA